MNTYSQVFGTKSDFRRKSCNFFNLKLEKAIQKAELSRLNAIMYENVEVT